MRRMLALLAACGALAMPGFVSLVSAQVFPERPITLVVPFV